MNRQIRALAVALVLLFCALFVQLNRIQLVKADEYAASPLNNRQVVHDFSRPRGSIQSADGVVLAESVPSDDRWERQRRYPTGDLFAQVTGYWSFTLGSSGLERSANDDLSGSGGAVGGDGLWDLFRGEAAVDDVTVTLRNSVQQVAKAALGEREGSVVALDPRTGAVLALWSFPSFDPNALATHDFAAAEAAQKALIADPRKPLLGNAYQEIYFPGSTFKIVTSAAGLDTGTITPATTYPVERSFTPPQTTRPVRNFGGSACGGDLFEILRVSCNTSFARMGLDIGAQGMVTTAEKFGFNSTPALDLPRPAASSFPSVEDFADDLPKLAQASFGQNDVRATPLQMAMVAGAVANGGTVMTPHVIDQVRDQQGNVVRTVAPRPWTNAMTPATANTLTAALVNVVKNGTAKRLAIDGVTVGGKTGTAQLGTTPPSSHAWIVGFAPAEAPRVAVAVLVKAQPGVSEITGGTVAAPIAKQVLEAALQAVPS